MSSVAGGSAVGRSSGVARSVMALLVGRVGTYGVALVTGVVLARSLGPDGRGAYQAVVLWPQVLGWIATLGFTKATTYYRAHDASLERGLIGNAFVVCMTTGTVFGLAMTMVLPRLLRGYSAEVVSLAEAMLWCVPFLALSTVLEGLIEGTLSFRTLAVIRLVAPVSSLVGLAALWSAGRVTVTNAVAVYAASVMLMLLVTMGIVWSRGDGRARPDGALLLETGRYALQYYPYALADIGLGLLDQMLLVPVLSAEAVGLYVIATRAMLVAELPIAVSQVLFASIAGLERAHSLRVIRRAISGGAVISGLCTIVFFVLAGPILKVLYGEAFLAATSPFRILLLGAFAMGIRRMIGEALGGLGRPRSNSVIQIGATVVLAVLLAITVPRFGIMGAAWSVATAHVLNLVAGMTWLLLATGGLRRAPAL